MADHDEMIAQFSTVTGCDSGRAQFYLESSGWQLQVALASFYDEGEMADIPDTMPTGGGGGSQQPGGAAASSGPPGSKGPSSRFATISDMNKEEEESDSDNEGQAFYAGGSEQGGSGQQIVGPGKKKKASKIVEEMFKAAKEHGAQEVEAGAPPPPTQQGPLFRGAGYRLGDTEGGEAVPVPGTSGPVRAKPKDVHVVLKLWKNGFSVNDEELRSYKDPKNAEFLNSVTNGEIPRELVRQAKGGEVNLDMEDHRDEEYTPPKVSLKPFTGEGHKLGSPTPSIVTQPTAVPSQKSESAPSTVQVDTSQPITTLQIRLADGSRVVNKFNHTHTVGDIRRFIIDSRPQYVSHVFALQTTFPNKELTDDSQTLAEANLLNAVIVQRLK